MPHVRFMKSESANSTASKPEFQAVIGLVIFGAQNLETYVITNVEENLPRRCIYSS